VSGSRRTGGAPAVLITGANGFLGCHLAVAARQAGAIVHGLDLPGTTARAERVRASLGAPALAVRELDRYDLASLGAAVANCRADIVVHLAGSTRRDTSPAAWVQCAEANARLTATLVGALTELAAARRPVLVMPGTQMEYGLAPMPWTEDRLAMPTCPYGATKLAATGFVLTAVRRGDLRGAVTRLAIAFGRGQQPNMLVPELLTKALRGEVIAMTHGQQRRRFVPAEDVADHLVRLGLALAAGESVPPLLNAPAGPPLRVADLARAALAAVGGTAELALGALPVRADEQPDAWPDTGLVDGLQLGTVRNLATALRATADWYRENGWFLTR
jgi:nucleoside-diphosphate-sugar epimerase